MVAAERQIYTLCQALERGALNPNRQAFRAPIIVLRGPAMGTRNIITRILRIRSKYSDSSRKIDIYSILSPERGALNSNNFLTILDS